MCQDCPTAWSNTKGVLAELVSWVVVLPATFVIVVTVLLLGPVTMEDLLSLVSLG